MWEINREAPEPVKDPDSDGVISERLPLRGVLGTLDFLESTPGFQGGPVSPRSSRVTMAWSFIASLIDALVVISILCLFMSLTLFVERFGVGNLHIEHPLLLKAAGLVFVFLYPTYLIMLRVFLGNSLGEWSCDLRLGEPRQRFSSKYSLLVLFRFAIVVCTGVVTLPLLSLLSGVDWAGRLSGLPLISLSTRRN